MIRSQRRVHRVVVTVLGPVTLVVLGAAVASREPLPIAPIPPDLALGPGERAPDGEGVASRLWTREDLFGAWPARVTVWADGTIELKPLRPIVRPDVLVYWVAPSATGAVGDLTAGAPGVLPTDAHLLGRLGGAVARRFALPEHAQGPSTGGPLGGLVLYSLGHQEAFAWARLPGAKAAAEDGAPGGPR